MKFLNETGLAHLISNIKSLLAGKVDKVTGKGLSTNDYDVTAKTKVDAIPESPKYTDTVTTINGKTGAIAKADIVALGIPAEDTDTTYVAATTSANGLMSSTDKGKLDGIATGANNYTHPSSHAISFITGLQTALDGKSATSHTHSYLPLSGGIVTGSVAFNNVNFSMPNGRAAVYLATSSNLNDVVEEWVLGSNGSNFPASGYWYVNTIMYATPSQRKQIAYGYNSDSVYTRYLYGGAWSSWRNISNPSWSDVSGKPSTFPPSSHTHAYVPTTRTVNGKALSANISLTAANVGAAATSHGNHVPTTGTASNKIFLRNDNTWQTVTPANIGAAAASHTHSYAPVSHNHTVANITDLTGGIVASGSGTNNWWYKLTNGTIVKYGFVSLSTPMTAINYVAQSNEFTITFNTGAPFTVIPTVNISGRSADFSSWPAIYNCTTTGFQARLMARAASAARTWHLHYTAVGR